MCLTLIRILYMPAQRLLQANDLPRLCRLAPRCRNYCAVLCVVAFLLAVAILVIYRQLPFVLVPKLILGCFIIFVLSAMFASRFGRLCNAEINPEYAVQIANMVEQNTQCAAYLTQVRQQNRPFTRLDLEQMSKLYLYRRR